MSDDRQPDGQGTSTGQPQDSHRQPNDFPTNWVVVSLALPLGLAFWLGTRGLIPSAAVVAIFLVAMSALIALAFPDASIELRRRTAQGKPMSRLAYRATLVFLGLGWLFIAFVGYPDPGYRLLWPIAAALAGLGAVAFLFVPRTHWLRREALICSGVAVLFCLLLIYLGLTRWR